MWWKDCIFEAIAKCQLNKFSYFHYSFSHWSPLHQQQWLELERGIYLSISNHLIWSDLWSKLWGSGIDVTCLFLISEKHVFFWRTAHPSVVHSPLPLINHSQVTRSNEQTSGGHYWKNCVVYMCVRLCLCVCTKVIM